MHLLEGPRAGTTQKEVKNYKKNALLTRYCNKRAAPLVQEFAYPAGCLISLKCEQHLTYLITYRIYGTKLLNADWLRWRAFFFLITKALLIIKKA